MMTDTRIGLRICIVAAAVLLWPIWLYIILAIGQTLKWSIIIKQIRDLGLKQPIFGGAAAVDNSIIINAGPAAEGYMGGWLTPLYLDSNHAAMVKYREAFNKVHPNAPKGRPNLYDIMGYTEVYVIAEGMRRAGPDLDREKFVSALETLKDYRVSEIASPRTFTFCRLATVSSGNVGRST